MTSWSAFAIRRNRCENNGVGERPQILKQRQGQAIRHPLNYLQMDKPASFLNACKVFPCPFPRRVAFFDAGDAAPLKLKWLGSHSQSQPIRRRRSLFLVSCTSSLLRQTRLDSPACLMWLLLLTCSTSNNRLVLFGEERLALSLWTRLAVLCSPYMLQFRVCEEILVACDTRFDSRSRWQRGSGDTAKTDGPYAVPGFMDTSTIRAPSCTLVKTHDI